MNCKQKKIIRNGNVKEIQRFPRQSKIAKRKKKRKADSNLIFLYAVSDRKGKDTLTFTALRDTFSEEG